MLTQVALMHTAKRAQEIARTGPEIFNGVDVYLADPIAIIIACPFVAAVCHRDMFASQICLATPFIGIDIGTRSRKGLHLFA